MTHKEDGSSGNCSGSSSSSVASCSSERAAKKSAKTAKTPTAVTGLGRKGDARMHKAVATRLSHPQLSLFNALREGGFDYTIDQADAKDSDGVCLSQRKNQLSRRLRLSGRKRNVDVLSSDPSLQLDGSSSSVHTDHDTQTPLRLAKHHPRFVPLCTTSSSQQRQHTPATTASSTTLQSLTQTAQNAGLTLAQLADRLAKHPQLLQVDEPGTVALAMYQSQVPLLRSRALFAAGFCTDADAAQAEKVLRLTAWKAEGQALGQLPANGGDTADAKVNEDGATKTHVHHDHTHSHTIHTANRNETGEASHSQPHSHDTTNKKEKDTKGGAAEAPDPCCIHDRHLHRLEGKCGHQAILHKPADGDAPHIDFVVGDRVECYQHASNAVLQHPDAIRAWPSRFTCEDLSCNKEESACKKNRHVVAGGGAAATVADGSPYGGDAHEQHEHTDECLQLDPPKVYNLDDLDLTGDEWNVDFGNDSSLLGLFKLSTPEEAV